MTTTTEGSGGRLGNQIIRNLFVSILAKNNDLKVIYNNQNNYYIKQQALGCDLFSGFNDYPSYIIVNDNNIIDLLNKQIKHNIHFNDNVYFQTYECSNYLFKYIQTNLKDTIIENNQYNKRYNNNDDVFLHIRLDDVEKYNPGFEYYDKVLSSLYFNKGFIATDSPNHNIIKNIIEKYKNIELFITDEVETIQFGSTCKYVILSHGSFSFIIGCFSFYSIVFYPEYEKNKQWYGDMFTIPNWNKVKYLKVIT